MIPRRATPQRVDDQGTVKKATYARFFWPILRGIALIVAFWAFIPFLFSGLRLYGANMWPALPVFAVASFAVIYTAPRTLRSLEISPPWDSEPRPEFEGEGTGKARQHRSPDWPLLAYGFITGLGYNWACAFLWFSRRYAFFSGPVVGATGLIIALYAAIALLVALLTGGNWRKGLIVFATEFILPAIIVLRLHLLR